ncbi:Uncharacterised protein [Candidatus Tiddalikarchaeum anstoanum]|nr:Uncharacterised protein [Candidatus Tiddalikarchaeum anstoanum]
MKISIVGKKIIPLEMRQKERPMDTGPLCLSSVEI